MLIYYRTPEHNIAMHLHPNDRWYLIADLDAAGVAHLYLNSNGTEYPLMSRLDLSCRFSEIDDDRALRYFNDVIYEAFLMHKRGYDNIDFFEIEADTLPGYLCPEEVTEL